jgi:hypothetical protein
VSKLGKATVVLLLFLAALFVWISGSLFTIFYLLFWGLVVLVLALAAYRLWKGFPPAPQPGVTPAVAESEVDVTP